MPDKLYLLLSFSISFLVVLFAIPKIILVAKTKKLFDIPNQRSANLDKVIPNLGGIAIFSGFFISAVISLEGFDVKKIERFQNAIHFSVFGAPSELLVINPNWNGIGLHQPIADFDRPQQVFISQNF